MTRSIFDPTGGETEHSGSRNLGPDADNISHMPPEVVDGKVEEEQAGAADSEATSSPSKPVQVPASADPASNLQYQPCKPER